MCESETPEASNRAQIQDKKKRAAEATPLIYNFSCRTFWTSSIGTRTPKL